MTRPREASERFVARLPDDLKRRVEPVYAPLIEIVPTGGEIEFGDARAVIFTSAHGVAAASGGTRRRDLPAYCVGLSTTESARRKGWTALCMGETAQELARALLKSDEPGPMLHLSGVNTRGDIAETLSAGGRPTRRQAIYDQPLRFFGAAEQALLASDRSVVVPIFSPRTARQFADQCPAGAASHLVALSPAVAEPLSELTDHAVVVSEEPTADSMVLAIESLVNRLCRVESGGGAQ
ncbi:uroporphyrinogen-III synthase [Sedimentitalea sp. JM2-8]|uniref:Uroporphyrinogen-III synthase n=1 Tax=Sedimentitalea xiamensis TaxID=3050037 RepID=A0ABT7F9M2_9RHOB|nr:uroporphyrinogen-III synthase [Sedimentitalea xiamensis]MDK3071812.1 uroporphyrinogen-III synthase [Sedimentitalea xiamensis]